MCRISRSLSHLSTVAPDRGLVAGELYAGLGAGVDGETEDDVGATPRSGDWSPDDSLLPPAAILESLPDAVVAAASDGRIVFVNARAEELFGYTRQELLGQPVQTLWPQRVRERYTRNMELYFAREH